MSARATPAERAALARAYLTACTLELAAPKPGNVRLDAPAHGMRAEDFVASAQHSAPALVAPGLGLGERLHRAVAATRAAVGCNTNLGIVLLCGPLLQAALAAPHASAAELRAALRRVLRAATVDDARWAYRAIRLAAPAGLGASAYQDVRDEPDVTLLAAMRAAAGRDRIAHQYASGFADVFERVVPALEVWRGACADPRLAPAMVFLELLACHDDSHIARKHGVAVAREVRARAGRALASLRGCTDAARLEPRLLDLDRELRAEGLNPGTSADLTVAGLLVEQLSAVHRAQDLSDQGGEHPRPGIRSATV